MEASQRDSITNTLGVRTVMGTGKYLGLPSMVGCSKEATFGLIKDHIWHKINSWFRKCLSKAGREVMIKSVLQSIPSYIMSIHLLHNKLIDGIEKIINAFWWCHGVTREKVCTGCLGKDCLFPKFWRYGIRGSY